MFTRKYGDAGPAGPAVPVPGMTASPRASPAAAHRPGTTAGDNRMRPSGYSGSQALTSRRSASPARPRREAGQSLPKLTAPQWEMKAEHAHLAIDRAKKRKGRVAASGGNGCGDGM